jgi:hypothetical protein
MKNFLTLSLWKIILSIIFSVVLYFLLSLYLSFFGIVSCPLNLPSLPAVSGSPSSSPSTMPSPQPTSIPELSPTPEPYTFNSTIQQIPNVITGNYDHCNPPSGSLAVAETIVNDADYALVVLLITISYLLSCGIVSLISKLKNKNNKKK